MRKILTEFTIGIDEVGRGPIAGPVAVGAFLFLDEKVKKVFGGVKESKQLSESKREEWFKVIQESKKKKRVDFQVTFQSEKVIDSKGLSYAIRKALESSLGAVVRRCGFTATQTKVLLDGGLKAPAVYVNQKTIIKGDEKEITIALASICAKVLRDRKMNVLAKKHPEYGFDQHKGYGTKAHYGAIRKSGLLPNHRRSFLKRMK